MSFISKLWKDRVSDYPNKRKLTKEDGTSETVTVERAEGDIVVAGDAFNAENMNDLETRIQNGFNAVEQAQAELNEKLGAAEKLEVTPSTDLLSHYIVIYKQGSRIFGSGFFTKNPGALVIAPTKIENLTGTNILLNGGVSTTFTIIGNPFNLTENLYYVVGNATWTVGASPNDSTLGLPLLAKFNGSDTEIINYKHPSLVTYNTFNIEFVAE